MGFSGRPRSRGGQGVAAALGAAVPRGPGVGAGGSAGVSWSRASDTFTGVSASSRGVQTPSGRAPVPASAAPTGGVPDPGPPAPGLA